MFKYFVVLLFLTSSNVFGVSVIDSGQRTEVGKTSDKNDIKRNSIDAIAIDVDQNEECPNLTPELIDEIKSHQPIVNAIVNAVVNGKYSGDTWNA